ncbi:MAG: hypothetical protein IJU83_04785 [Clostridia bacterium]|nr:hypothetical protein [Clostridia bacterium]
MKIKKSGLLRVENLINNDRMKYGDGFLDLLTGDVDRVLKDYFDYKGAPNVEMVKNGNVFALKITLTAEGVRAFSVLPQEI